MRGGRNLLGGLKNLGGSVIGKIGAGGRTIASGVAIKSGIGGALRAGTAGAGALSGAAAAALPAAAMLAGGYATDWAAGKLGAGKDENWQTTSR